jgi:RNA polymerase sigma factor (TIGR02999 family)
VEEGRRDRGGEITQLLVAWKQGSAQAPDRLFPLVYDELRGRARRLLRRGAPGQTLDATALVHETYLKLVDQTRVDLRDRGHFFAVASKAMRQIIVDHARARAADKRGGGERPVTLDEGTAAVASRAAEIVAVDSALAKLEAVEPRLAGIVEMRFFAGLSVEETAAGLDLSPRTVKRDWQKARAFLLLELGRTPAA